MVYVTIRYDIRSFFCHVYLRSFLLCGVFIPKYMTNFLQTRIYMRTTKVHIYAVQTNMCPWGSNKSSYKRHRIIPSAVNLLHVRKSRKVTSVWRQNFHVRLPNHGGGSLLIDGKRSHCIQTVDSPSVAKTRRKDS